jgi:hypothetical protein
MALPWLLIPVLVAASCGSPTAPSPTPSGSPGPDVLTITPAVGAVKIGSTVALAAVVVSGDGTRRTVAASWSSDSPEVVAVSGDGRVSGMSLGKTSIHAKFEALSADQVMRAVPDYGGTWSGNYHVLNCTQISGNVNICDAGAVLPLSTVVNQDGASVTGTLAFYSTGGRLVETGPVAGSIDDTGALLLAGTTTSVEAEQPGTTQVTGWNTTLVNEGAQMMGQFTEHRRFQNFFGWQESIADSELVNVTRSGP